MRWIFFLDLGEMMGSSMAFCLCLHYKNKTKNKNGDIGRRFLVRNSLPLPPALQSIPKHSDCSSRSNASLYISGSVATDFVRTLFIYLSAPLHIFMS